MTQVPAIRSTSGCHVCRLRKKKCDESRPACQRCLDIPVQCHYGPRPDWLRDDSTARAELKRIKAKVRDRAKSRRQEWHRAHAIRTTSDSVETASTPSASAPRSPSPCVTRNNRLLRDTQTSLISTEKLPSINDLIALQPKDNRCFDRPPGTSTEGCIARSAGANSRAGSAVVTHSIFPVFQQDRETDLLMHYLDHVFHLQFRFYSASVQEGGRGWLLSLLLRTKPLYHAVLCLSAFHRQAICPRDLQNTHDQGLEDLENHRNLALKELQAFIQSNDGRDGRVGGLRGNIQILACIVELISFELFDGGATNWKLHLKAAAALVVSIYELEAMSSGRVWIRDTPVAYQSKLRLIHELSISDRAALRFFTGVIIWFDVLACISTGEVPYLHGYYEAILAAGLSIRLDGIMGCHNSPILAIGEIATLARNTSGTGRRDASDIKKDHERAVTLKARLETDIAQLSHQIHSQRDKSEPHKLLISQPVHGKDISTVVSHIFACAALLYLYTTVPSLSVHSSIQADTDPVASITSSLSLIADGGTMRGLLWPLCVAGQAARQEEDRVFFRKLLKMAAEDSKGFGNSSQSLTILEVCWQTGEDVGRTMQRLQNFVLLV